MRSTLHLLSLLVLTIFASQAWPVMAVPATPYEYDASIKDTSVENTELGHQNYAYDNIGNLQRYGVEAITRSQDEKTQIRSFFAFVDGLFVTKSAAQNFDIAPRVLKQLNDSRVGSLAGKLGPNDLQKLANNPSAKRFLDGRSGNINVIQEVEGKLLRITTPRDAQKIISVGPIRSNQVTNRINSGDFVPLK